MLRTIQYAGLLIFAVTLMLVSTGCDDGAQSRGPAAQADGQPDWKLAAMPDGAVAVTEAKADAKEGETITLIGRIGGRSEPITASSGLFVVMDTSIPSCEDNPEDHCATPWDYCCETPDTISTNAATIQLRDAEGKPVTLTEGDLEPLSRVAVVGTVAPRPNNETLVIHATGLFVVEN